MKKPTVFGKYLLLERVNVGGMAEVFVAKAFGVEGFERILAIKKILPTMAEDEEFITMFIDEARISVQLNHANVVHIHELGKHEDAYFIAMEYVPGKDLRALQDRFRRRKEIMPTAMAVFIASKICEGLDYAHRRKDARGQDMHIIHRDVSPQNILLSYEGEVKIIDFGIAKAANRSQKTQAGILKGKFGYMSPEQVRGLPIDRRSDIFAVGVILYEMLTGEKLFVGESDFSTLEKVRNAEVPAMRQFNPNIPAGLEKVVLKSLAREVENRYQWGSDMAEDLMRFLLAGEAIYSAKHLSNFLKEAFAEELLREAEKMERFAEVSRPDQMETSSSGTSPGAPPPQPAAPAKKKPTVQTPAAPPHPAPAAAPPRRPTSQPVAVSSGAGAMAVGLQSNAAVIDIPPPTEEELAEMEQGGERTVMTDGAIDAPAPTSTSAPAVKPGSTGMRSQLRPSLKTSATSSTQDNLEPAGGAPAEPTMPPEETRVDSDDPGLEPIAATGFRSAIDALANKAPDETLPPKRSQNRPKIVIGDAPPGGATTVGQSPFAKPDPDGESGEAVDQEAANHTRIQAGISSSEEPEAEAASEHEDFEDNEAAPDDEEAPSDDEGQALDEEAEVATGQHQPIRSPSKGKPAKAGLLDDKKKLMMAMIGAGAVALLILALVAVKLVGGGGKARVVVGVSPKMAFTVTVTPPGKVFDGAKAIELDPGDYELDVRPASEGYKGLKKKVSLKGGETKPVAVAFQREEGGDEEKPPGEAAPPKGEPDKAEVAKAEPPTKAPEPAKVEPTPEPKGEPPSGVLKSFDAVVTSPEPGVEIFIDGRLAGKTPDVTLKDLDPAKTYKGMAKKAGFEPLGFEVANPKKLAKVTVPIELVKEAKPEPVRPVAVVVPPKPEPKVEPKVEPPKPKPVVVAPVEPPKPKPAPASAAMGKIACGSNPMGAEVWVDGKNSGRKTPVPKSQPLELPVGKHKVIFKLDGKATAPQEVVVSETDLKVVKGEF